MISSAPEARSNPGGIERATSAVMASFEVFLRKNGLLVACLRLATALILLIMSMTDPGDVGFQLELDDVAFSGYFVWALVLLILCIVSWELSFALTKSSLIADVAIFLLLPHADLPLESDLVIGTTVLAALTILNVGLRWGSRQAIYMAAVLNLACIANCGIMILEHHHSQSLYVRQIVILAITSVIAIWATYRILPPRLPMLDLDGAIVSRTSLEALLQCAMSTMNSRKGWVLWKEVGDVGAPIEVSRNWQGVEITSDAFETLPWPADNSSHAIMIGGLRGFAICSDRAGLISQTGLYPAIPNFAPGLRRRTVLIAKLQGLSGEGLIILSDIILPAPEDVQLFDNVVKFLEQAINKLVQTEDERTAAIHGTRRSIARDLHDSVAQSLAGAKFHLAALLRDELPPNVSSQLSKLKQAIDHEHASIRDYIDTLRSKDHNPDNRETLIEIAELCERVASNWNVSVELDDDAEFNPIDRGELLEIRQIIREGVANAVRHGGASRITIGCSANDLGMRLTISDNGRGMKPYLLVVPPRSIAARVAALRGTLTVASKETGMELHMFIPMGSRV